MDRLQYLSAEYRDAMATREIGVPGKFIVTCIREHSGQRSGWIDKPGDSCQHLSLVVFLKVIYRFSVTAPLIRPGGSAEPRKDQ